MRSDDLRQRFEALETDVLPLTGSPAAEAIRRRGRRRQRTIRAAVLLSAMLLGAAAVRGVAMWSAQPELVPVGPPPTTRPVVAPSTTAAPATETTGPVTSGPPATSAPPRTTGTMVLRPDGLGVAAFGADEQDALRALQRRLGQPDERGSWSGATPFGTCPGPVRAVRWGRLYVLFTNGPTRFGPDGRWHLFAWQVNEFQITAIDPQYSGPTPPPDPPPLHGYSPRTATGIGFGSTVTELRAVYGSRLDLGRAESGPTYQFTVRRGATIELFGSLTGGNPGATVTWLAAGAVCGE
ncbi:MAG TPA: hypothetical protein VFU54_07580 [Actinomycetota bacterium]|nr:hypothetical protein [Actinomycetota bacterium]